MDSIEFNDKYESVKYMVYKLANRFIRGCRGLLDSDDVLSEACWAAAESISMHDPSKGMLTTWVHTWVRCRLLTLRTKEIQRRQRYGHAVPPHVPSPQDEGVNIYELLPELSEDAATVLLAVMRPSPEVLSAAAVIPHGSGRLTVKSIKQWLRLDRGWTHHEVCAAIREVRQKLTEA